MDIEKIEALPLTKAQAMGYAKSVVGEQMGKPAEKVRYMGGGSFGRAVSVRCKDGQTLAVKFLRAKDMMQKEAHDLKLLAGHCTVKVPRVFFTRPGDPRKCFSRKLIRSGNVVEAILMAWAMDGTLSTKENMDERLIGRKCYSMSHGLNAPEVLTDEEAIAEYGARRAEICALKWSDVNWKEHFLGGICGCRLLRLNNLQPHIPPRKCFSRLCRSKTCV